jgi:hypothetical protein
MFLMHEFTAWLGLIIVMASVATVANAADSLTAKPSLDQPEARVFTDAAGASLPYLLLKPKDYDPAKHYPIVMFYHGAASVAMTITSNGGMALRCFRRRRIARNIPASSSRRSVPWTRNGSMSIGAPNRKLNRRSRATSSD